MLGQILGGRYQILSHLGGGGFGQTYLAIDRHLPGQPQCVVKQLKPRVSDPEALEAARRLFNQEAEVLYSLGNHDQIPKLYAHFEENEEFYLVQEFIDGEVLNRVLKRGKTLPEAETIALLRDILVVLTFIHEQQVIHRDIKPSNLIRRRTDRRIVLIDFGVVKQIGLEAAQPQALEEQTTVTIAIGSSGYMPNEQLAGKPRFSSDIYAVGMVGIRALTGQYPTQLAEDPRTGEILWQEQAEVGSRTSPELAVILETMVRYDCRQRYQSAAEALAAISELQHADEPTETIAFVPATEPEAEATVFLASAETDTQPVAIDREVQWQDQGDELFQHQRYEPAIACYDRALQTDPDNSTIWLKRGLALDNLSRYAEAVVAYDRVTQLVPDDYLAWIKQAKALEHLEQYAEALAAYDRVVQLQPDHYWTWHDRGKVLEQLEQLTDALAAYERSVQLKPDFQLAIDSRKALLRRSQQTDQLYQLHHFAEAIASCDQTLQEQPNDALAWLMRGMAQEHAEQYEAAIASYNQVVRLQPTDQLAWFKRGTLLEKTQHYPEALASYNQVLRLQPDNCWAWHDRGRVLFKLRHYQEAMLAYDRAIRIRPDFQDAVAGRQQALTYLKQSKQAAPQNK